MKYRTGFIGNDNRLVAKAVHAATYKTRKRAAKLAKQAGCTMLHEINYQTGEVLNLSEYLQNVEEAKA